MANNIALGKSILENDKWEYPEVLTNGKTDKYNKVGEYAESTFPQYCTIDLEKVQAISVIRFLLYNINERKYLYRLLTSTDKKNWNVHYDTDEGTMGWQNFKFSAPIDAKYVRIHCLWNSRNVGFHIIEIEVYNQTIELQKEQQFHIIKNLENDIEISDGQTIARQLIQISNTLIELPKKNPSLDKQYFNDLAEGLREKITDIDTIEKNMNAVRNQIIDPVNKELSKSNSIGKMSIILGLVGGITGIFSILNSIFKWIE